MASQPQVSSKKQQELQLQYTNYKNALQQLAQKIGDIEQEAEEHKYDLSRLLRAGLAPCASALSFDDTNVCTPRLVIDTLKPLPQERKCFRMVNGVLVERTVQDVLPSLETNSDGLKQVLEELLKQYKSKQTELDNWKKKNNIQVVQP